MARTSAVLAPVISACRFKDCFLIPIPSAFLQPMRGICAEFRDFWRNEKAAKKAQHFHLKSMFGSDIIKPSFTGGNRHV
jgi:hypothetical protein